MSKVLNKILFFALLFCQQIYAQKVETKKEVSTRELSVKASLVVPIYYDFYLLSPDIKGYEQIFNTKPDFKLNWAAGIQHKSKQNIVYDLQFQHYNISFKGPIKYDGNYIPKPYYNVSTYGQFRISHGIGFQKKINNKTIFSLIFGNVVFLGDQGAYNITSYSQNGIALGTGTGISGISGGDPQFGHYINVCYSLNILKNLSLNAIIDNCFLYYKDGLDDDYYYRWKNFLSLNIGLKYNIISKDSEK